MLSKINFISKLYRAYKNKNLSPLDEAKNVISQIEEKMVSVRQLKDELDQYEKSISEKINEYTRRKADFEANAIAKKNENTPVSNLHARQLAERSVFYENMIADLVSELEQIKPSFEEVYKELDYLEKNHRRITNEMKILKTRNSISEIGIKASSMNMDVQGLGVNSELSNARDYVNKKEFQVKAMNDINKSDRTLLDDKINSILNKLN